MPKLTVEGVGQFDVESGKRLVLALTEDAGVDQLHACGGFGKCTTCRVEMIDGNPTNMTQAENDCLTACELSGVRLSCQIACEHDMSIRVISRLEGSGRADQGKPCDPQIQPEPVWIDAGNE